ncbi:hypothetical protein AcW1_003989 [Taiwanofungus camphoratus]|nr:hypothetical protein AcV5_003683 [Antrodia cinnamomea]KAI0922261.1 hypothetical protein AcW2_007002 [Antrodia cinnamomea]KAI0951677.1 hypothetical protein AcV7_007710 [Antrodia cinnamomea]KAI0959042.1 hypothetical protein AcW1_003989 [Antrodia cinnamomea]
MSPAAYGKKIQRDKLARSQPNKSGRAGCARPGWAATSLPYQFDGDYKPCRNLVAQTPAAAHTHMHIVGCLAAPFPVIPTAIALISVEPGQSPTRPSQIPEGRRLRAGLRLVRLRRRRISRHGRNLRAS